MQRIALLLMVLWFSGCGGARGSKSSFPSMAYAPTAVGSAAGSPGGATATAAEVAIPELPQQLVVEGSLQLAVAEPAGLLPALRAQIEQQGGRIVEESESGLAAEWQARVKLRVPPAQLDAVLAWLATRGDVLDKQLLTSDVAKQLFDAELALKNATITSERLEALIKHGGLTMADVLAVERELTRLRGEIETIKGQAAFLKDRVALSTLEIIFSRKSGSVRMAEAKVYPGARFTSLILLDPDGRARTRVGGGFVLHTVLRAATFELDLFQEKEDRGGDDAAMSVLATFGGAMYSDFLGRGERQVGNPYLGFRTGYGYLDSHRWVVQAEAGVELWKSKRVLLDVNARATGLIGERTDAALVLGGSAVIAF